MAYIGRSPEYGNAVSQQITGTNSAGPYTLSYDTSTSGVVVSLDGVVQRNSVDFNIVGTALTFTSTVASGIIINVVFTGLTLSFPTPSDGSVDSSAIVAGAVDDSHISGLAASKLTGTIADARFPATLPATSGVNLTALNASNLGSGTVPTARLGTGTASSSTFLRGDQTYAEAGGGKVLQVKMKKITTAVSLSISTHTWTDITGLSVAITPSSSSSVIKVFGVVNLGSNQYGGIRIVRDSTAIGVPTDSIGSRAGTTTGCQQTGQYEISAHPFFWIDEPSTSSSVTYKIQAHFGFSGSLQVNREDIDADHGNRTRSVTTLFVEELSSATIS